LAARADSEKAVGSVQQAWQQALLVAITVGNPVTGDVGLGPMSNARQLERARQKLTVNPRPEHCPD
jgi:hypothetical protein